MKAFKWFLLGAEQGDANAQLLVGMMYQNGNSVAQDFKESYKWATIARANGNKDAMEISDNLEKEMTPSQIAEAQKLANAWLESHRK